MDNNKPILIYGSREFSNIVRELLETCGFNFAGLIDDFYKDKPDIIGSFEEIRELYPPSHYDIALAIGYNNLKMRSSIYTKITAAGYYLPKLIHPSVIAHKSVQISEGAMLMAGVIADINVQIGAVSVLWPGVVINHDSVIGGNTFLSPSVTICGFSSVGHDSFIGAGAIVTDHVGVPDCSFVRAGEIIHTKSIVNVYKA